MNRDKHIEEMVKDLDEIYSTDFTGDYASGLRNIAEQLADKGYRKASDVARETVDDFQSRIRHIFLNMCAFNDYNTLNLLQIDNAIEALYDTFIAELKKKYGG